METLMKKTLETINLGNIILDQNVRHQHLWHLKSYNPNHLSNYSNDDLVKMAITIIGNILKGNDPFDNEPTLWFCEEQEEYVVQTGNTRVITLMKLPEIVDTNYKHFRTIFEHEELVKSFETVEGNFSVIDRELSDSEKRRENNVRSDQHWFATAIGYYYSLKKKGVNAKKLAAQEGLSAKKIVELSKLQGLSAKAKSLCINDVIGAKVAVVLSKLDKSDRELVVDHIIEKEYTKIENPGRLMIILQNSYTILEDDYPMDAFANFCPVEEEPWYLRVEDGMFIKHLSKDPKASNNRKDLYYHTMRKPIYRLYPEAKVLSKKPAGMVITEKRTCMNGKPYIIGTELVFGCKAESCEVHGFKIEFGDEKAERKEKVSAQNAKQALESAFKVADEFREINADPTVTLNIISLQFIFSKLKKKGVEATLEYLNSLIDPNADKPILVNDFEFTMLLGEHDVPTKYGLFHLFGQTKFEWICQFMSLQWLKSNRHLKNYVDSYLGELEVSIEDQMVDEDSLDKVVESDLNHRHDKLKEKIARENKKKSKVLDFLVHMLGINVDDEGVHIDTDRVKDYLLGSYEKDRVDVTMDEGRVVVGLSHISKNYYLYAQILGIFKKDDEKYKVFDENEIITLINDRVNEFAPFIGDYWNQEEEDRKFKANIQMRNAALVYNSLYSHLEENTDMFFKGVSVKDILKEAIAMVNITFKTASGGKKLKLALTEPSGNELRWRKADIGLTGSQIDELIYWYVPTSKIHAFLRNG